MTRRRILLAGLFHETHTFVENRTQRSLRTSTRIYADFFKQPYPARTTITNCLSASLRYEIECIAVVCNSEG